MQEQIAERQMQDNRRKAESIAENEARWNLALSGLIVHLIAILIGYACHSAFGVGIIIIASIIFVIYMCSVDYPIYQDKWILYGIVMTALTIFKDVILGWIAICVMVGCWRHKDGQKWIPRR